MLTPRDCLEGPLFDDVVSDRQGVVVAGGFMDTGSGAVETWPAHEPTETGIRVVARGSGRYEISPAFEYAADAVGCAAQSTDLAYVGQAMESRRLREHRPIPALI